MQPEPESAEEAGEQSSSAVPGPGVATYLWRIAIIAASLGVWFGTQAWLARRQFAGAGIEDGLFRLTANLHHYLLSNPALTDGLLIVSSLGIDLIGCFLLLRGIVGPTIRPFLGLFIIFLLRQICQGLILLPEPPDKIWHDPGFPTLLVTYGTATDLFFSAHTALTVFGATELARMKRRGLRTLGVALAVFEATTVIVLRAHYTMDVFTGAVVALWVAEIVERLSPSVDRLLSRAGRSD